MIATSKTLYCVFSICIIVFFVFYYFMGYPGVGVSKGRIVGYDLFFMIVLVQAILNAIIVMSFKSNDIMPINSMQKWLLIVSGILSFSGLWLFCLLNNGLIRIEEVICIISLVQPFIIVLFMMCRRLIQAKRKV